MAVVTITLWDEDDDVRIKAVSDPPLNDEASGAQELALSLLAEIMPYAETVNVEKA